MELWTLSNRWVCSQKRGASLRGSDFRSCKKRCSSGAESGAAGSRVDLHQTAMATKNPGKTEVLRERATASETEPFWSTTPGGIRTPNLRFRRPLLYPVELRARMSKSMTKSIRSPRSRKRKSKAGLLARNSLVIQFLRR
jgi:hypothetical protein